MKNDDGVAAPPAHSEGTPAETMSDAARSLWKSSRMEEEKKKEEDLMDWEKELYDMGDEKEVQQGG